MKDFIYLILETGEGREKERDKKYWCARDTSVLCLSHNPDWEPDGKARCVLWLGITVVTFRCAQAGIQSSELHHPGCNCFCLFLYQAFSFLDVSLPRLPLSCELSNWVCGKALNYPKDALESCLHIIVGTFAPLVDEQREVQEHLIL